MTLTEFLSENDIGTRRGAGNSGISLADLQSRRVPVDWFEAVAIVQESCRALLESHVDPDNISLAPKDVFIEPCWKRALCAEWCRGGGAGDSADW